MFVICRFSLGTVLKTPNQALCLILAHLVISECSAKNFFHIAGTIPDSI